MSIWNGSFSIGGYLALLKMKRMPVLLVEGKVDKQIASRVIHEFEDRQMLSPGSVQVDTSDMVDGREASIDGRQLVEHIHDQASFEGLRVGALVDREFREFEIGEQASDQLCCHKIINQTLFWTRGHSIENYFFQEKYFLSYLKHHYPEHLNLSSLDLVRKYLPSILLWAAALSISLFKAEVVMRSAGIAKLNLWVIHHDGRIELDLAGIAQELERRHAPIGTGERVTCLARKYVALFQASSPGELIQWINHGHLGFEWAWAGVGRVLQGCGVHESTLDQIANGQNEQKIRKAADTWANEIVEGTAVSPDALWAWVRSSSGASAPS